MTRRFNDQVALVTGAASGIGRATALAFAQEGAKVILADNDVEGGEQTIDQIKDDAAATFVKTDVSNADDVEQLLTSRSTSARRVRTWMSVIRSPTRVESTSGTTLAHMCRLERTAAGGTVDRHVFAS